MKSKDINKPVIYGFESFMQKREQFCLIAGGLAFSRLNKKASKKLTNRLRVGGKTSSSYFYDQQFFDVLIVKFYSKILEIS